VSKLTCGGGIFGEDRSALCLEEPFLHALFLDETDTLCCTKHVRVLKYMRIMEFNGTPQVHEVTSECLDPESVWDVEENCCVLEEDEPLEISEREQMLAQARRRYLHR
jgi:hypothetical protein